MRKRAKGLGSLELFSMFLKLFEFSIKSVAKRRGVEFCSNDARQDLLEAHRAVDTLTESTKQLTRTQRDRLRAMRRELTSLSKDYQRRCVRPS